jgi:hypothetical protein
MIEERAPGRASLLFSTILRSSCSSQNSSESFLLEPVLSGEIALPAGNVAEPFADAEDIADVAVAARTEDGHAGELYELTGPRLLPFAEAVGEIAQAADREVRYVPISVEQFAPVPTQDEVPPEFTALLTYLFTEALDGRSAHMTDGVQRILGSEPRDFTGCTRDTTAPMPLEAPVTTTPQSCQDSPFILGFFPDLAGPSRERFDSPQPHFFQFSRNLTPRHLLQAHQLRAVLCIRGGTGSPVRAIAVLEV